MEADTKDATMGVLYLQTPFAARIHDSNWESGIEWQLVESIITDMKSVSQLQRSVRTPASY